MTVIIILLLIASHVVMFFIGGKWKARVMKEALDLELSAKAKIEAIRKKL